MGPVAFLLDCYKNLHYIQTSNKHGFFSKHLKVFRARKKTGLINKDNKAQKK